VHKTTTSTMVIQNMSIEGAYDEAIEDAARRILEASRPQRMVAIGRTNSMSAINVGNIPSPDEMIVDEKNDMMMSSPSDNYDNNSDEISALDGDNSTSASTCGNYTDDDDIESNIQYLEEKKRILKRAKMQEEKEEAYIADNAYDIVNGLEPSARRDGSSSIWSEAKAMVEEFKLVGVGGGRTEEEDINFPDLVSSSVSDTKKQGSTASHTAPDICLSRFPLSSSSLDSHANNAFLTRKRPKINLSMVKQVSSTEYSKDYAGNEEEVARAEDGDDHTRITGRSLIHQNYVSPAATWEQAGEMQLATDSRNWISQAVLKQILTLTNSAISEHRRSIIMTGKGE